jgi:hypothetical protein
MPMSLGKVARKVLGPRLFHIVGHYYVNIFGDYRIIAKRIIEALPPQAKILDIGGGDGAPLNYVLSERPDARVTMIDIKSDSIGGAIKMSFRSRVETLRETSMRHYCDVCVEPPDVILILSVMHHIAEPLRAQFMRDLRTVVELNGWTRVIFKEGEPDGSFISRVGYLLCRYVSNDPNTKQIGSKELTGLLRDEFGDSLEVTETDLYRVLPPHYVLVADIGKRS